MCRGCHTCCWKAIKRMHGTTDVIRTDVCRPRRAVSSLWSICKQVNSTVCKYQFPVKVCSFVSKHQSTPKPVSPRRVYISALVRTPPVRQRAGGDRLGLQGPAVDPPLDNIVRIRWQQKNVIGFLQTKMQAGFQSTKTFTLDFGRTEIQIYI